MSIKKSISSLAVFGLLLLSCNSQVNQSDSTRSENKERVGGAFENGEFIYYKIPDALNAVDTSAAWTDEGEKILLTGIVYEHDGRTPAKGVVLYYYHTNTGGRYIHKPQQLRSMPPNALGQTHGYIRGWVKTGDDGKYFIYTLRPGSYPSHDEPAHVHVTVKEPNEINEYYIDDFVFDDDRLLTSSRRKKMLNRGGNGTVRMVQQGALHIGERNIILGLNIPNYPSTKAIKVRSGNNLGEEVFSFMPFHAWGPDKGTKTCPVCKYGWYHGILYFVGNKPDWSHIKNWLLFLEGEAEQRKKYFKAYFVYGNENKYNKNNREKLLEDLGKDLNLTHVALTFVPSFSDSLSEIKLNNIDPDVESTFILYRRSKIIGKFINLEPSPENFTLITQRLEETINEYFHLPNPLH
ncbi:MAG TPA: hypothetical protein VEZ55_02400 [Chitinophagaceae bacterium]|nr:hypothetical protein [Chitinophagaceae bacterium]